MAVTGSSRHESDPVLAVRASEEDIARGESEGERERGKGEKRDEVSISMVSGDVVWGSGTPASDTVEVDKTEKERGGEEDKTTVDPEEDS